MNARSTTAAAVVCALAIVLGSASLARHSERKDEASLVRLARDNAALDSRVRFTAAEIAAVDRDRAGLRAALKALPAAPVASAGAATLNPEPNFADLLIADPKLADMAAKAYRAGVAGQFRPLYRSLELTPDQIEKFESLMVEHQREAMDTISTARSEGFGSKDATIVALLLQENEELGTSQMALLGDAGYQQLQQFTRAIPVQGIVHNVADAVALSPSPLTGEQADQLSRILANSNSRFLSGGTADPAAIDWSLVLPQAQGALSEPQFKALQGQYQNALFAPILVQFRQQENAEK